MSNSFERLSRLKWFFVAPRERKSKKSFWSSVVMLIPYSLKVYMNWWCETRLVLQLFVWRLHSNRRPFNVYGSTLCLFSRARTLVSKLFGSFGFLYSLPLKPLSTMFYSCVVSWRFPMSDFNSDLYENMSRWGPDLSPLLLTKALLTVTWSA